VNDLGGAKIMETKGLSNFFGLTIHVTVNSKFMGFIDDMYIMVDAWWKSIYKL